MQNFRRIVGSVFEIVKNSAEIAEYEFGHTGQWGSSPMAPKKMMENTQKKIPGHLAVEAVSKSESGGLFLITHGSNGFLTEASFHCVNNSFFSE